MPSSFFALFDDIASLLDDVSAMTKIAAGKTAGVVGDDLALNAQQVAGSAADRELPVVWAVAKGSLINKAILVPSAMGLSIFEAWLHGRGIDVQLILWLLTIGGAYLCYEGVEKLVHVAIAKHPMRNGTGPIKSVEEIPEDLVAFEQEKIQGAIKTDFVLSAEIIVISLGTVAFQPLHIQFGVLAVIAVLMTVGVYGLVAAIVKLDDLGLHLSREGAHKVRAMLGRGILALAPLLMKFLSVAGTVAMFLVGGGILVHGIPLLHHLVQTHADDLLGWLGVALFNIAAGMTAGIILVACTFVLTRIRKGLRRAPA
ncbi:MAG: DUF808 domain-containing protein [Thermomonas sp.]|uniref:DUF808 domain-containing protein n=1 Tax=Thermomonas sp. TaxID=1971895 RepID=UPI00263874F5|nr:DUF808 domain-containing protein [Thermomonas sp.]MCC7096615.1 DUF808 domain-containing protein [Thermomonas sp.]